MRPGYGYLFRPLELLLLPAVSQLRDQYLGHVHHERPLRLSQKHHQWALVIPQSDKASPQINQGSYRNELTRKPHGPYWSIRSPTVDDKNTTLIPRALVCNVIRQQHHLNRPASLKSGRSFAVTKFRRGGWLTSRANKYLQLCHNQTYFGHQ